MLSFVKFFFRMKRIITTLIFMFCLTNVFAQANVDALIPLTLDKVKVEGEIGRRIDLTIKSNLLELDVDKDFLAPFLVKETKKSNYIGLGKLIDATAKFAAYTGDPKVIALKNKLTSSIVKAQETDGYLGNMAPSNRMWKLWDVHEVGYIIYGLITDYTLFGSESSLAAAKKGGDYLLRNWSSMPIGWQDSTGVGLHVAGIGIDRTMIALFKATKDRRYLDFCDKVLHLSQWNPGIVLGRRKLVEGHIYSYMAASLAQLELYRLEQDKNLLIPTMNAIDFLFNQNGVAISGGAGQVEIWTNDQDGGRDLGETCATAYQLRVYDNLLRIKEDSRYGDIMERTIFNALFGAQSADGRKVRYFTPLEGDRSYHDADTYCCPNNYRRIVTELPAMIYYKSSNGIAVNLYSESKANIQLSDNRDIGISQQTNYPNSGKVIIHINPLTPASFSVKLRIPLWCKKGTIFINGEASTISCIPGTFAVLERVWKSGDQITLDLPMEWRFVKGRERQAGRVAIMRGPLLFGLDPTQEKSLEHSSADDLGRLIITPKMVTSLPVSSNSVRSNGISCHLKAGSKIWAMDNPGNLDLLFSEFTNPNIRCTYFKTPNLAEAVEDELIGLNFN
jgi:DUF1680 family protein